MQTHRISRRLLELRGKTPRRAAANKAQRALGTLGDTDWCYDERWIQERELRGRVAMEQLPYLCKYVEALGGIEAKRDFVMLLTELA